MSNSRDSDSGGNPGDAVLIGGPRVALLLSQLLPQVCLTLVSIFQATALAVLFEAWLSHDPSDPLLIVRVIGSVLVLVFVWYSYSWAFLAFLWPLSVAQTVIQFLLGAAQIFAFHEVASSRPWVGGLATAALIGAVIRKRNTKIVNESLFLVKEHWEKDRDLDRKAFRHAVTYAAVLSALLLLTYLPLSSTGVDLIEWATASFVVLLMAWQLRVVRDDSWNMIRSFLTDSTSLCLTGYGQLAVRCPPDEPEPHVATSTPVPPDGPDPLGDGADPDTAAPGSPTTA